VVEALETVAKWVAKLPPALQAPLALQAAPLVPVPLASLSLEVDVIPRRGGLRQGTKRLREQVNAEDLVQAQILGEIEASQSHIIEPEPVLGRGKRVKRSTK
jgi:hypothetical protein